MRVADALIVCALVLTSYAPASAQLVGYHPYLAPEPSQPTCEVKASVYIGTQYFDAIALSKPTASPVPTTVSGLVNFEVVNLAGQAVEVCHAGHCLLHFLGFDRG